MKTILVLITIIVILSFKAATSCPIYYLSMDCAVIAIKHDTLYARKYAIGLDLNTLSLEDTIGMFSLNACGNGFYKAIQIFDTEKDPFKDMYSIPHYSEQAKQDSITVRIFLPEICNNTIVNIKINRSDATICTNFKKVAYEAKLPRNSLVISFELTPLHITPWFFPITQQGLSIGKLKFHSPSICLVDYEYEHLSALDIFIPNYNEKIFSNLYVPESYIYIDKDHALWLGQKMNRIDSIISNPHY